MHVDSPGVSVASATLRATDAPPEKHLTLFREGGFPALPSPRRDRSASDYHLLRELGRGLCGTVYLGRERDTGRIVAFKVMRKTKLVDVGEANHASEERRLHERISDGPFINRLLASFQDPWALFLILEYAPCGDLFQAMNFHGLPTRGDAVTYAVQVATALEHLHGLGYVYRDLKPENILLHPHGSVQLADFGMAKRLDRNQRTYTICGTAQYMSPEVLLHRGCQFEADLWAMGIFVYELVTGDTPFSSISGSRQELYRRLMSHDPEQMAMPRRWIARRRRSCARSFETRNTNDSARGGSGTSSTRTCGSRAWTFSPFSAVTSPRSSRREGETSSRIRRCRRRSSAETCRGGGGRSSRIRRRWRCSNVSDLAVTRVIQRGGERGWGGERARVPSRDL